MTKFLTRLFYLFGSMLPARQCFVACARGLLPAVFFVAGFPAANAQGTAYSVTVEAPGEIRRLLEENLPVVRWRDNDRIDPAQLRLLYRKTPDEVRKLLETEGYFAPEIRMSRASAGEREQITVAVEPGEPVRVSQVEIVFTGAITQQEAEMRPKESDLRERWALREGARFRQADWEAAKGALLRQVRRVRYPRAKMVRSQADVDPETLSAVLHVEIDSGMPVRFGEITIEGLARYGEEVIMRERPVKPGSVYRQGALAGWQARIQDTGYFRFVEVFADLESGKDEVPVTVKVVENKKRHAAVGVGYSTDMGSRMSLTYDDRTLLGRDWNLKSALIMETRRQTGNAEVFFPRTAGGFSNSVGGKYERSDIQGEDTRLVTLFGKTSWGRPRFEQYVTLEYLNENARIKGAEDNETEALPLSYGFIRRALNNRINPTRGYAVQAQIGGAAEGLLTDESFIRPYLKAAYFHPVGKKGNLLLRTEMGAVLSSSRHGIPDAIMFRTGGDQSVRGYAYESLGVSEGRATVGGRYLAVGSVEYQYYFYGNWGAALFVDAGNAADNFHDLEPAVGYGIGARWRSPAGPLGIDVAYGEETREFRVHFSFGYSF
ncbi:MAG: autotransporter assembly complex protein TamA [Alistipes senegalensis]|nr:autotransporter assembly complex protein TamA [Oxalobacter formigenes]MCM1280528.1 autotransporter assembly complex protein TamA [Alistipes senegalensis]